jgi:hypothetical protein
VALRIAVNAALAAKSLPLREQSQGHHLTPAEGSLGARVWFRGQRERAKVIDHHVKSSQEGVHIDHRSAPYLGEERAILPAGSTFCVAMFINSDQAFKYFYAIRKPGMALQEGTCDKTP